MSERKYIGSTIARFIAVLITLSLIAVGVYMAYNAGVAQGISQAPEVAQAIQQSAENGNPMPMFNRGYGYPFHHGFGFGPHFGFFPFGFCFSFLLLFFFFGMLRFIFRPWAWHKHGGWGKGWEHGVSSKFDEWHKRAHGEEGKQE